MLEFKIGYVLKAQGIFAGALEADKAALAIFERLATSDPGNSFGNAFRDVLVGGLELFKASIGTEIGDGLKAQGNLAGALDAYKAALAIRERLAKSDPSNARCKGCLAILQNKIGDLLQAQGNLADALDAYKVALAIFERLATSDPSNAGWQGDLATLQNDIGDVLQAQGNLAGALEAYKVALAIFERQAKSDPSNATWKVGLATLQNNIGAVLKTQGKLADALEAYNASLTIVEHLAKSDPSDAAWQRVLSQSLTNVASVQMATGKLEDALANYDKALAVAEKLASIIEAAEIKSGGKAGRATASELGSVSWCALFARDYAKALSSADRALTIAPNELWIQTNRAHALMLLGRIQEARALYVSHSSETIPGANKPWRQAVLEDFVELQNAGLKNVLIPEIEAVFGTGTKAVGTIPGPALQSGLVRSPLRHRQDKGRRLSSRLPNREQRPSTGKRDYLIGSRTSTVADGETIPGKRSAGCWRKL
jgi:tetratricopeptide (TPR) repeat protein